MQLYNTLTRKKEEFKPIEGNIVKMYSCGPTVYNYAHIGNIRAYIFMDILSRVLKYNGYELLNVMNITDVGHLVSDADEGEDKMEKAAREQKKNPLEIAEVYTNAFMKDMESLNIERPKITAKATEHIAEMLEYVEQIVKNGYGYETSKGIYFDTSKLSNYGILSGMNKKEQIAGARIEVDAEKKDPLDFAIWIKAPENHIMKWNSPWGKSYPGWHIECSAMSKKYLGEVFDIHTGGVDHIPIHHENEIAQSIGATGKIPAKVWMHGEFLLVDNGKMSKSLGNVYTIPELQAKGFSPLAYRYFCLNSHYRNKLNFTFEAIESAQTSLTRLRKGVKEHYEGTESIDSGIINNYLQKFEEAVNDDLNVSKALAILWDVVRNDKKSKDYYDLAVKFDTILALDLSFEKIIEREEQDKKDNEEAITPELSELLEARKKAREEKNWTEADKIRDKLTAMGIRVIDGKDGKIEVEKI